MSTKIGRNDPCPCGSGKKYKRCHLPLDQQSKPVVEKLLEAKAEIASPPLSAKLSAKNTVRLLRNFAIKIPEKERAGLNEILTQVLEAAEFVEQQEEIEAAGEALKPYRQEFDRLLDDQAASFKQAETLFGEERFAPLWFTAQDIRRAFNHTGRHPDFSAPDEAVETIRLAILFVADKERRTRLAVNLAKHIPYYVKAGRFMDAWLIQYCGHSTSELAAQSNPFLYEMFSHGYEAWSCENQARSEELMREQGLDPARLQNMSWEEIDSWLQDQEANPASKRRIEAFMNAHPDFRDMSVANTQRMEREFVALLGRRDTRALLLPEEEVEAWLPMLMGAWQKAIIDAKLDANNPDDEQSKKLAEKVVFPLLGEMAQAIFTPERIKQLMIQLAQYQKDRFTAGDKAAAACVMPALASLKAEPEPGCNYYLISLCFASLGARIEELAKSDLAQG